MTGAEVTIRVATKRDLDAIAALVSICDRTYTEWAPPGWQPPPADEERDRWRARWSVPGSWTRVATDGTARVVGVVSWAQARELDGGGDLVPGLAHVGAVYVHPDRWREGIAADLLGRAEDAMRESGYERAQLWTPEEAPARRLYDSMGWEADGRRQFFAVLNLPLVAYSKRL